MTEFVLAAALLGAVVWVAPYALMIIAAWGLANGVFCATHAGGVGGESEDAPEYLGRMFRRGLIAAATVLGVGLFFSLAVL